MAGSLNHVVGSDGEFTPDMCENMRDCYQALAEAHQFIAILARRRGGRKIVEDILDRAAFPSLSAMPKIIPEMHGADSAFRLKKGR